MNIEKVLKQRLKQNYFGSKSRYHQKHPDKDPIFNAKFLYKDNMGLLSYINFMTDFVLDDQEFLISLKEVGREIKKDIYIYRESTVHNETFNGRIWPYNNYVLKYDLELDEVIKK